MGYKSISFPAIGTGNLGFKKYEVARIMTDAVVYFAKNNTKQLDVNFVVYPKDKEMMEVMYTNYVLCFSVIEHYPSFLCPHRMTEFFNQHLYTEL